MHQLAAATRHKACSFTAFFLFTLALRYGGDPGQANHAGVTALSLLPDSLSHFARLTQKMIAQARERARHVIANPKPQSPEERNGTLPRVSAVMMAQARRLCEAGHDPLLPHESLFASATTLRREGVDLTQMHLDGSPPVLWLALRGYCGAAEVLLAHEPDCNVPRFAGNTLMHYLAAATRCSSDAIYADYMLNTALRYGGDPTICNLAGDSALTPLTPDRIRFLRAGLSFIDQTRKSATLMVNSRHGPLARANPPSPGPSPSASMRHSAAAQ